MNHYTYCTLRERPELLEAAASWFSQRWGVPAEAYLECMFPYLAGSSELGWYLCLHEDKIAAGLGVIENDFHDRKDLTPNVCAVYTDPEYRRQGIAGHLLGMVVQDCHEHGIAPLYLLTDHIGLYERYGWHFLCMAQNEGESTQSRIYMHD